MLFTLNVSSSNDPWYAVHCKHRREFYAANVLKNHLGLSIFLPESRRNRRGEIQRLPFFPGYLFVQANLQNVPLSKINTTPGVLRLVEFGGGPQPISPIFIETLREEINRLNAQENPSSHAFCPGDLVRIKKGPLQNLEMIFVGPTTSSKRVQVLLSFLGRLKEMQVEKDALERVSLAANANFR